MELRVERSLPGIPLSGWRLARLARSYTTRRLQRAAYQEQALSFRRHRIRNQEAPVQTLEYPNKETKSEYINSFTQLDYIVNDLHQITGTFHFAPRKDEFVNLDFFNRRPVTPNWKGRDFTGTLIDRYTIGTSLLESGVSVKSYTIDVWGQGRAEMNISPAGNTGNYFSEQNRDATRAEWTETVSLAPITAWGAHNLKFGTVFGRTTNDGQLFARPVNITDAQSRLLRRIEFTGGQPFDLTDTEVAAFGQDHWNLTPKLSLDAGFAVRATEHFGRLPLCAARWVGLDAIRRSEDGDPHGLRRLL
jgi:hypothetical protein